jgi:hypothetical protein
MTQLLRDSAIRLVAALALIAPLAPAARAHGPEGGRRPPAGPSGPLPESVRSGEPTTGSTDVGAAAAFGPGNPLALRYRSRFPPVVHVLASDGSATYTAMVKDGRIQMVTGLVARPFVTYNATQAQIEQAAALAGNPTAENKLELVRLFIACAEKPVVAPPPGTYLPQPSLLPVEKHLMALSAFSRKIRWLFNKVEKAPNQIVKIFWGLQIKLLTLYIEKFTDRLVNDIWEEVDGELDRGQEAIVPGRKLDLMLNVAAVHVMYRDDDMTCYGTLVGKIKKRLIAEQQSLPDYPPGQAEARRKAIEKRLAIVTPLSDLIEQG